MIVLLLVAMLLSSAGTAKSQITNGDFGAGPPGLDAGRRTGRLRHAGTRDHRVGAEPAGGADEGHAYIDNVVAVCEGGVAADGASFGPIKATYC